MNNYFQMLQQVAHSLKDITFMKFGLPIITVLAVLFLVYFGLKGIIKRETVWLLRPSGEARTVMSQSEMMGRLGKLTGGSAIMMGIVYLILAIGLAVILGPLSYYLLM